MDDRVWKIVLTGLFMIIVLLWLPMTAGATAERVLPNPVEADSVAIALADSIADSINLDEVVVTAKGKPIVVHGDTTIISADAFGVREGDLLEDLVKRIPGLEYDEENGTLKYMGKPLREIMVNGHKFFGKEVMAALRSLPAELIDKLKVYDRTSEEDEFAGRRSQGNNYVLDLQTKGELNGTFMATAGLKAGNEEKRAGRIFGNYFKKGGDHLSANISSGNENERTRYKDARTDAARLSLNKRFKKISVNGNLNYNHSIRGDEGSSYRENYFTSGNNYNYSESQNVSRNRGFAFSASVNGELDSLTYISFNGDMRTSGGSGHSEQRDATFSSDPGLNIADPFAEPTYSQIARTMRINENRDMSQSDRSGHDHSFTLSLTRKLDRKGKTSLTLSGMAGNKRNGSDGFRESKIIYYQLLSYSGGDSVQNRRQYNRAPTRTTNYRVGLQLTRKLTGDWAADMAYGYRISRERSLRSTYDLAPFTAPDSPLGQLPSGYEAGYVDSLSNHSFGHTVSHEMRAELRYSKWGREKDDFSMTDFSMGITVSPERRTLDRKTGKIEADTVRSSVNYTPFVRFSIRRNDWGLDFNYNGNTRQPSLSDLMAMTDNSNPLYITHGNPNLKAGYSQDFSFSFNAKSIINGSLNFQNAYNDITRTVIYNPETGGSVSYPENINGNWNLHGSLGGHKWIMRGKSSWSLTGDFNAGRNQSVSLVNENRSEAAVRSVTQSNNCQSNLGVRYDSSWCSCGLWLNWNYMHSKNRLHGTEDRFRDYNCKLDLNFMLPCNISLGSDVSYSLRNGAGLSRNDEQTVWNMKGSWRFLKGKKMVLSVEWIDILNDSKSYLRSISSSGVSEVRTMRIGGYFMVGLSYSFSSAAIKDKPAQR